MYIILYLSQVKFWITINEPSMIAWIGYGRGKKAPGVHGESDLVYTAGHNLIRAHSAAYRMYQKEFHARQKGMLQHIRCSFTSAKFSSTCTLCALVGKVEVFMGSLVPFRGQNFLI